MKQMFRMVSIRVERESNYMLLREKCEDDCLHQNNCNIKEVNNCTAIGAILKIDMPCSNRLIRFGSKRP